MKFDHVDRAWAAGNASAPSINIECCFGIFGSGSDSANAWHCRVPIVQKPDASFTNSGYEDSALTFNKRNTCSLRSQLYNFVLASRRSLGNLQSAPGSQ